jgi:hypothetical protein
LDGVLGKRVDNPAGWVAEWLAGVGLSSVARGIFCFMEKGKVKGHGRPERDSRGETEGKGR